MYSLIHKKLEVTASSHPIRIKGNYDGVVSVETCIFLRHFVTVFLTVMNYGWWVITVTRRLMLFSFELGVGFLTPSHVCSYYRH